MRELPGKSSRLQTLNAPIAFLLTLALCYLIPTLFSHALGSATIAIHLVLTGWMLWHWRWGQHEPTQQQFQQLLLTGIVARAILLFVPGFTTHDVERYLWDGAVVLSGLDPYTVAPNDAVVSQLRELWPTPAEHAAYPTLYPPLALTMFALCALAGPVWGILLWKLVVTAASIATLLIVADLLKRAQQTRHLALIALSPLMLLEVGIGAHLDAFSALAISGALWACARARWWLVGVALGLGGCIKLLPIVALGPLLFASPINRWGAMIGGTLGSVTLIYGSAMAVGFRPIGTLGVFFDKWRNGSPINSLLEWSLPAINHTQITVPIAVLAVCYALHRSRKDLKAGLLLILATPLLLSPVVFSWYLLVLVPLFALRPNLFLLLWLTTVPLAYEVLNQFATTGEWSPASWPLWVIAGGWLVGLLADRHGFSSYTASHHPAGSTNRYHH